MKIYTTITLVFYLLINSIIAQVAPDKYYIQFTDKNNSPYTIEQPEDFLSNRAILRRAKYDIQITEEDLPVNPSYLQTVADSGAQLLNSTKWMNGVTVFTTDTMVLAAIEALPFVESMVKLPDLGAIIGQKKFFANESVTKLNSNTPVGSLKNRMFDYGGAGPQIEQLEGDAIHDLGFQGQGMVIAVLDGGFRGTDEHVFFDSLFINNRMLGTKDFVTPGASVYTDSGHGNSVLSTMAAFAPGDMIGTAPRASYWLLRSEDVNSENIIEEYNWVSAAEYADSVGADVINSSLGYIDFDNPLFDHTYSDMDGITNVVTRGADKAVEKGIMVVNSAGNSGNDPDFPYIGAPADGLQVFTIGAVDPQGNRASFSSIGPTYDGRIKPVVDGTGQDTFVAYGSTDAGYGNGTSYSSPVIAGMTACLMQAHPEMTVMEIQEALKESGSLASDPNSLLGWGIPDYFKANGILTAIEEELKENNHVVTPFPNPFSTELMLTLKLDTVETIKLEIIASSGALIYSYDYNCSRTDNQINLGKLVPGMDAGVYYIRIVGNQFAEVVKVIKR